MTPFPYPRGATIGRLSVNFLAEGDGAKFGGDVTVSIVDDGGGHFVELAIVDGPWRANQQELAAVAAWCAETCKAMDERAAACCGGGPQAVAS
jgi:hypothetical protein